MRAMSSGYSFSFRHWFCMSRASASGVSQRETWRSVMTQPGSRAFTRMPSAPNSRARALVRPTIAALAATYTGRPGVPLSQVTELRLMIEPPRLRRMPSITACAAKAWWRRFTSISCCQSSVVRLSSAWRSSLAALFTSTSMSPKAAATRAIAACSAATSLTSQCSKCGRGRPWRSRSSHSVREDSSAMSTKPTRAPWRAKCPTRLAPMPLPPPLTKTTRSRRLG